MKGGREDVDTPFEFETQGFQGLVDQKSHFQKETFFEGIPAFLPKARNIPMHIINENVAVFLVERLTFFYRIYTALNIRY